MEYVDREGRLPSRNHQEIFRIGQFWHDIRCGLVKEHRGTQVPNELISKNAVERFLKKKTPSNSKSSK